MVVPTLPRKTLVKVNMWHTAKHVNEDGDNSLDAFGDVVVGKIYNELAKCYVAVGRRCWLS